MAQAKPKSNPLLYFALLATIAAAIWVSLNDETEVNAEEAAIVQPIRAAQSNKPTSTVKKETAQRAKINALDNKRELALSIPWNQLERTNQVATVKDIFTPHSWVVIAPPPPPPPEPPPPPPQAPPVPFVYMGKMVDAQNSGKIFLTQNSKFYYVAKGENINAEWRFDKEEANVIRLTYLPLNLPKILSKSAKRPVIQPTSVDTAFEPN